VQGYYRVEYLYENPASGSAGTLVVRPGARPTWDKQADMKTVPLHGNKAAGRVALVDDADYEIVRSYRWCVWERPRPPGRTSGPYAEAFVMRNGRQKHILMHKLLTGYPKTDHVNGDGLDNQRSNLRPATQGQNAMNRRSKLGTSSKFKGVSWDRKARKWHAFIKLDGRQKHLGFFTEEEAAARAYDSAARELFGEYAKPNFA